MLAGAALLLSVAASVPSAGGQVRAGGPCAPGAQAAQVGEPAPQSRVCRTPAELDGLLRSGFIGTVIIPRDADLDMTGLRDIPLRSGIRLVGQRGALGSRPVLRTRDRSGHSLFTIAGPDVVVQGLHLEGPSTSPARGQDDVFALHLIEDPKLFRSSPRPVLIADNEIAGWPGAAVYVEGTVFMLEPPPKYHGPRMRLVDANKVRVERNFIHHNARDEGGYGVVMGASSYATVTGNVFDFNRHAVTSSGHAYSGYVARFNYVLAGGHKYGGGYYGQHFDVHGVATTEAERNRRNWYGGGAGEYHEIAYNTVRGEQVYDGTSRAALLLRGKPASGLDFNANVLVHERDEAVRFKRGNDTRLDPERPSTFNFRQAGNRYDTDHATELATGDFDGDGRADVFLANGTAWFFSRAAVRPWEFLRPSNKRIRDLGFADIDNDAITDVLYRDPGGRLGYVKSGAAVQVAPLTTSPVPIADLRFGDFDGDGLTDIFYTLRGQWWVWYGRTRAWTRAQTSSKPISELLFGEFDDVRGTDVVGVNAAGWQYSSATTLAWAPLNGKFTRSFSTAVAADLDGNGRSDILVDVDGEKWLYSRDGRMPLGDAQYGIRGAGLHARLKQLPIGRFDGGTQDRVVSFGPGSRLLIWRGLHSLTPFGPRSSHNMR